MPTLIVTHLTRYRYAAPVRLGPHRLMLRPRESVTLSVLSERLTVSPSARLDPSQDVHGNTIVEAGFDGAADSLITESVVGVDLKAAAWPVFAIAASAQTHPFAYSHDDATDLGALLTPQFPDPDGSLAAWARGFVMGERTDTLSLLKDINLGIHAAIAYRAREAEGIQALLETLALRSGSCRDLATLMAEAARLRRAAGLGLSARPRPRPRRLGRHGLDPCLARHLPAGIGLDRLRPHQPQPRRRQSHPRCGLPRPANDAASRRRLRRTCRRADRTVRIRRGDDRTAAHRIRSRITRSDERATADACFSRRHALLIARRCRDGGRHDARLDRDLAPYFRPRVATMRYGVEADAGCAPSWLLRRRDIASMASIARATTIAPIK